MPCPARRSPACCSPPHDSPVKPPLSNAGHKTILDLENHAEAAKVEQDRYHAHLSIIQDSWNELDRWVSQADVRNADARSQFNRIVSDASGFFVPVRCAPSSSTHLPSLPQQVPHAHSKPGSQKTA